MAVHKTAIIEEGAEMGENVEIGPYAIIGKNVIIGDGTKIGPHVLLDGWTKIGRNCRIYVGAVIGTEPQDLSFEGEKSHVIIGDNNVIREYVTIHRSRDEEGATEIGNDNFLMANVHIAHDCKIGNGVIIVNFAGITGHITIEDRAFISGLSAVHQFTRIGTMAMVGGASKVVKDVPPYTTVDGHPAKAVGLNIVALRRANIPPEIRKSLSKAYHLLYNSNLNVTQALKAIEEEVDKNPYTRHLVDFIRSSKRGICRGKGKDE